MGSAFLELRSDVLTPAVTKIGTAVLVKTDEFEVFRLDIPAGTQTPQHKTHGTIIVQCIDGLASFVARDVTTDLIPGQFLYLPPNEPHTVRATEETLHELKIGASFAGHSTRSSYFCCIDSTDNLRCALWHCVERVSSHS